MAKNHAEKSVKIEAGALIAKVRKTAWPKNREELEDNNWLFEQFYELESPMVKLMPNLVQNDKALGLRFKLFVKRLGTVFHWDKGSNTCYYTNHWFQQGEKVLHTDL